MKVMISEAALEDLIQIGHYIRHDIVSRAQSFVSELYDKCQRLSTMPKAFPLLPNWEEQGIRRRPHGPYLIFYRVVADRVEVLHILHGARDIEATLFGQE